MRKKLMLLIPKQCEVVGKTATISSVGMALAAFVVAHFMLPRLGIGLTVRHAALHRESHAVTMKNLWNSQLASVALSGRLESLIGSF